MQKLASIVQTSSVFPQIQAARDDSTTTSPIPAGFTSKSKRIELPTKEHEEAFKAFTAEEIAQCTGCDGFCSKSYNRWQIPELYEKEGRLERRYVDCKFRAQRAFNSVLRSARIPDRYRGKTFDDYKVDNFNRVAVDFAKNIFNFKVGAYFYGACGTGKTFLASIIAQEFMRAGKTAVFIKVPSLLDDIKATFDSKGADELNILDKLRTANLVVLDDFGMEKSTQWAGSTLCKVLDMRYDNPNGRTIVTSNLSIDELADQLNNPEKERANLNGSRIADRLCEICKPILLKGTTRRH